jgi:uncharacterized protein YoxC
MLALIVSILFNVGLIVYLIILSVKYDKLVKTIAELEAMIGHLKATIKGHEDRIAKQNEVIDDFKKVKPR